MDRYNFKLKNILFVPLLCGTLLFAEDVKNENTAGNDDKTAEVEIVKNLELLENLELFKNLEFFKYMPFLELNEGEEEQ